MHGYLYKSKDIQMNIQKSMDNWRLISIKQGYPLMNTYCLRISIAECPYMNIPAWISTWISTCMDNWRPTSKNHRYPCWYPWIFENHAWICYGFLDQGRKTSLALVQRRVSIPEFKKSSYNIQRPPCPFCTILLCLRVLMSLTRLVHSYRSQAPFQSQTSTVFKNYLPFTVTHATPL